MVIKVVVKVEERLMSAQMKNVTFYKTEPQTCLIINDKGGEGELL